MAEITYADSFVKEAEKLLLEMLDRKIDSISFSKPFSNFSVVIGETNKKILLTLELSEDIKEKLLGRKIYIVRD